MQARIFGRRCRSCSISAWIGTYWLSISSCSNGTSSPRRINGAAGSCHESRAPVLAGRASERAVSMSADADKAIAKADAPSAKRNAMSLRHRCAHLRPARPTGRWLGFNIRQASVHTIRSSVNCSDHTIRPNENNRATLAPIRRAAATSTLRVAIKTSPISAVRNALQANK
jgi:hypothetical protein